jgi:lipoprotein signal peptidase
MRILRLCRKVRNFTHDALIVLTYVWLIGIAVVLLNQFTGLFIWINGLSNSPVPWLYVISQAATGLVPMLMLLLILAGGLHDARRPRRVRRTLFTH